MSNVFAAIGLSQLKNVPILFQKEGSSLDLSRFDSVDSIRLFDFNYSQIVPHIFPIHIPSSTRDRVRTLLSEDGIQTGFHYFPNHLPPSFVQIILFQSLNQLVIVVILPFTPKHLPNIVLL